VIFATNSTRDGEMSVLRAGNALESKGSFWQSAFRQDAGGVAD